MKTYDNGWYYGLYGIHAQGVASDRPLTRDELIGGATKEVSDFRKAEEHTAWRRSRAFLYQKFFDFAFRMDAQLETKMTLRDHRFILKPWYSYDEADPWIDQPGVKEELESFGPEDPFHKRSAGSPSKRDWPTSTAIPVA